MIKNFNVKNIPADIVNACPNPDLCGIPVSLYIPKFEFGKTYYMSVPDSPHNKIRIDRVFFNGARDRMNIYIIYHTSDGETRVENLGNDAFNKIPIFSKLENYKKYCLTGEISNDIEIVYVKDTYFKDVYNNFSSYVSHLGETILWKYCWRNGKVHNLPLSIERMWIDKDGSHMTFSETEGFYQSQQECFDANFEMDDEEFEEDKPKVETFKITVTLEIQAKTLDEAQKVAEEKVACLTE